MLTVIFEDYHGKYLDFLTDMWMKEYPLPTFGDRIIYWDEDEKRNKVGCVIARKFTMDTEGNYSVKVKLR